MRIPFIVAALVAIALLSTAQSTTYSQAGKSLAPYVIPTYTYSTLPALGNGSLVFCSNCKNVTDDTTGTFDSAAASGGHGTLVLRENSVWRVH